MASAPTYAILIPSRGRWDVLAKTFARQPFLNAHNVYIGIENDEYREYMRVLGKTRCHIITYNNKEGSVGIAREKLRLAATRDHYDWYVATDDNARYTEAAVSNLVTAAHLWQVKYGLVTLMAGMHSTASHFDRGAIAKTKKNCGGFDSYAGIGFIFHTMPHGWYAKYSYPASCFALEDRHMMLSAIAAGYSEFRVCMDAPFSKSRYQPGGQGDIPKRQWNCGRAIEQLAHDFPAMVGARGTFPLPWQFILKLRDGANVDRLMGGAMRKGDKLERTVTKTLRARVRRVSTHTRRST